MKNLRQVFQNEVNKYWDYSYLKEKGHEFQRIFFKYPWWVLMAYDKAHYELATGVFTESFPNFKCFKLRETVRREDLDVVFDLLRGTYLAKVKFNQKWIDEYLLNELNVGYLLAIFLTERAKWIKVWDNTFEYDHQTQEYVNITYNFDDAYDIRFYIPDVASIRSKYKSLRMIMNDGVPKYIRDRRPLVKVIHIQESTYGQCYCGKYDTELLEENELGKINNVIYKTIPIDIKIVAPEIIVCKECEKAYKKPTLADMISPFKNLHDYLYTNEKTDEYKSINSIEELIKLCKSVDGWLFDVQVQRETVDSESSFYNCISGITIYGGKHVGYKMVTSSKAIASINSILMGKDIKPTKHKEKVYERVQVELPLHEEEYDIDDLKEAINNYISQFFKDYTIRYQIEEKVK